MHIHASNSELVESLPEPKRTLNRRRRRQNRRVPYDQRNNPPQHPRIVYSPILDINHSRHFLVTLENLYPMDDEPMWAADRVVTLTPGSAITIPDTANEFPIKGNAPKLPWSQFVQRQYYQNLLSWSNRDNPRSSECCSWWKIVAFADEGSSNSNTNKIMARMDAITMKMDAQYKELQTHAKKTKLNLNEDDIPMSHEEEAKFMQTFPKIHQASIQNLETKFDRLADKQSGRPSGSLPSNTQPNPKGHNSKAYQPPQSRNEHINAIFTRSGKSYNPPVNPNDQQNDSENPDNFDSDEEDEEPTPQPKTQNPKPIKETPLPKPYKQKIPYPQRLRKEKMEAQYGKFLDMIRVVRINVPLIDGIDFMGPFLKSYKFDYILVSVDYVSNWAEAQALPTNDARVVVTFLKKLFCHFRMLEALIKDRGTHFCNKIMEKIMKRFGVNHRFSTSYHPQTSGQVKNTNRALKRIFEKTVKDNPAIWSRKLDDALWAFRTAYKTPIGTMPYKLTYGKNCHLPFKIEHRAYWALKNCNPDLIVASEKRMFQLHELDELRHQAYENSRLYKERTKVYHDRKLRMRKEFKQENKVLFFHSKYKFKQPKLRSRWLGPYVVKHQYPSGYVELYGKDGKTFIVNGH
uniref:Reverse transcriptase domain-containing protein n=1 Tax=Tanacetum cinerariifolium TaxID=118510 RepID=A0A6L2LN88_TANCI|nr:reverse transcriptase domain-containing protein [Tanacetum cinerariifolium]